MSISSTTTFGLLILSLIFTLKSAQCQTVNSTFLTNSVCIKRGRLVHGAVTNIAVNASTVYQLPPGSACDYNSLTLDVGTLLNQQQLTYGGLCLSQASVVFGLVEVLYGDVVKPGEVIDAKTNKICSPQTQNILVVSINNNNTIIKYLPPKSGLYDLLVVREDPLLVNQEFTRLKLTEPVCLERGILVDGIAIISDSTPSYGAYPSLKSCAVDSVLVQPGVRNLQKNVLSATCMKKGLILSGRVLTEPKSTVKVNGTLSNGKTCTADGENGVVANPGVLLLTPKPTPPPVYQPYPQHDEYERRNYKGGDSKKVRDQIDAVADQIDDRLQSKLKQKLRSKGKWDNY